MKALGTLTRAQGAVKGSGLRGEVGAACLSSLCAEGTSLSGHRCRDSGSWGHLSRGAWTGQLAVAALHKSPEPWKGWARLRLATSPRAPPPSRVPPHLSLEGEPQTSWQPVHFGLCSPTLSPCHLPTPLPPPCHWTLPLPTSTRPPAASHFCWTLICGYCISQPGVLGRLLILAGAPQSWGCRKGPSAQPLPHCWHGPGHRAQL